jgi:hypothetical protein
MFILPALHGLVRDLALSFNAIAALGVFALCMYIEGWDQSVAILWDNFWITGAGLACVILMAGLYAWFRVRERGMFKKFARDMAKEEGLRIVKLKTVGFDNINAAASQPDIINNTQGFTAQERGWRGVKDNNL